MSEKVYCQVVDEGEQEEKRGIGRKQRFLMVSLFTAVLVVIVVIWLFLATRPPLDFKYTLQFKNNSTSTGDKLETLLETGRNLIWHLKKRIDQSFMDCGQQGKQFSDGKFVKKLEKEIEFLETLLKLLKTSKVEDRWR